MAIEEPAYTLVERQGPFEVRDYAGYLVARTVIDGSFEEVGNEGFRRLFRYISGGNQGAEKIKMTAPVEQDAMAGQTIRTQAPESGEAGKWRIAFVLPAAMTLASAPRPVDDRVQIVQVPPARVAVVRYRGTWSRSHYEERLADLRRFIAQRGLEVQDDVPVFARYDPPFMPWFLRRNEIQIRLQAMPH